ncbi:hypothetical protein T492DRAFT_526016 [Pavlovales sp. CCMP2436]|nr:hypothetical protein T492DRAFT_526016 [Pavlovales sp. CCMP2436]
MRLAAPLVGEQRPEYSVRLGYSGRRAACAVVHSGRAYLADGTGRASQSRLALHDTFEYLGHLLPTNGNWQAQERRLRLRLAQAMGKVHLASDKRAYHTLWTAKLSTHDAAPTLLNSMGASDLSEEFLKTMLTAIVEATHLCCTMGTHIARERLCGPPERGGLGLVDPRAQNAGEKVTTMLRLLNSPAESGTHALAAHALSIHSPEWSLSPSQGTHHAHGKRGGQRPRRGTCGRGEVGHL